MLGSALQAMKLDPRPKPFIENMLDAVHRFAGDFEQHDDLSLLAIRFKGGVKLEQKVEEEEGESAPGPQEQPVPEPQTVPEPEMTAEPEVTPESEVEPESEIIIEDAEATEIE